MTQAPEQPPATRAEQPAAPGRDRRLHTPGWLPDESGQPVEVLAPLRRFVEATPGRVLVIHDDHTADLVRPLGAELPKATLIPLSGDPGEPAPTEDTWTAVLAVFADRASLRRGATTLPHLGTVEKVGIWLAEAKDPAPVLPRDDWQETASIESRRTPLGSAITIVRFVLPMSAQLVIRQAAVLAARGPIGNHGVFVAATPGAYDQAGPADAMGSRYPGLTEGTADDLDVPPDVLVVAAGAPTPVLPDHHVIERPPVVVEAEGPLGRPIDEAVINPRGFHRHPEGDVLDLKPLAGSKYLVDHPDWTVLLDGRRGATEKAVRRLRKVPALRVRWPRRDHADHAHVVAGLAMAGIPVFGSDPPEESRRHLGDDLADLLDTDRPDLDTALRREEFSVRLRRAALLQHSTLAWRTRLARHAGIERPMFPSVSILLATMRPHQLEFALRQVVRQTGVDKEVVIAAHGWTPDRALVREHLGDVPVTILDLPADMSFGQIQNEAAAAASGDLIVKFDDDDWYAREMLTDLLLARHYARADMVGTTTEFTFLERVWTTVRRKFTSEHEANFVAGGSMLVDRSMLREWGGYRRVRRWVDADLLITARSAGAVCYRSHGLGYVLRRSAGGGHTWRDDLTFFLSPEQVDERFEGFRPSDLLDVDEIDLPERPDEVEDPADYERSHGTGDAQSRGWSREGSRKRNNW